MCIVWHGHSHVKINDSVPSEWQSLPWLRLTGMAKPPLEPSVNACSVHRKRPHSFLSPDRYSLETTLLQRILILTSPRPVSLCVINRPLCSTVWEKDTQLLGCFGFSIREPRPPNPSLSEPVNSSSPPPSQSPRIHTMQSTPVGGLSPGLPMPLPLVEDYQQLVTLKLCFSSVSPSPTAQALPQNVLEFTLSQFKDRARRL